VEMIEAAAMLADMPVVLWFVGAAGIDVPERISRNKNIRWLGPRDRAAVHAYYQTGDIFILPTHSDGFALTQLEAQAWGMPIIASKNCGQVVRDGENGVLLPEVTSAAIVRAISELLANPGLLSKMSQSAIEMSAQFHPEAILQQLETCLDEPQVQNFSRATDS
jgi:glycosyltransferase involved in cell wall biosynthesis